MDLNLSLSSQEQNDSTALILIDDTNNYDAESYAIDGADGDWSVELDGDTLYEIVRQSTVDYTTLGAYDNVVGTRFVTNPSGNAISTDDTVKPVTPKLTEITAATLDITITTPNGTSTVKDQIDLYDEFSGPWSSQSELIYTITAAVFGDASGSELDDGLYELTYTITFKGLDSTGTEFGTNSGTATFSTVILVYGQMKVDVYEKFRQLPGWFQCMNKESMYEILEADFLGAYLSAIEAMDIDSQSEELLDMMLFLQGLIANGVNIYY